jgi:hypothetical protein
MRRLTWHCGPFGDSTAVFGVNGAALLGAHLAVTVSIRYVTALSRVVCKLGDGLGMTAGRARPRRRETSPGILWRSSAAFAASLQ